MGEEVEREGKRGIQCEHWVEGRWGKNLCQLISATPSGNILNPSFYPKGCADWS